MKDFKWTRNNGDYLLHNTQGEFCGAVFRCPGGWTFRGNSGTPIRLLKDAKTQLVCHVLGYTWHKAPQDQGFVYRNETFLWEQGLPPAERYYIMKGSSNNVAALVEPTDPQRELEMNTPCHWRVRFNFCCSNHRAQTLSEAKSQAFYGIFGEESWQEVKNSPEL